MNWTSTRPWLGTLARLVLGVVFLVAGWQKLNDPRAFARAVRAYQATPEWLSLAIAYGLPVFEICLALLLIFGLATRLAASATAALLVVYIIGILQAAARGIKLECGCFGGGGVTTNSTTYLLDILRDVGLLALAVFVVWWPITRISIDEFLARNDNVEMPSPKRMRSPQGQRKYNAVLEARRKEARTRTRYVAVSMSILVVLVSIIGIGVQSNRAKIQGTLTATNASVKNGVVVGKSAPVTIDVYEDFQCPFCEQFQQEAGADLDQLISSGKAQVRYHMVSFLDGSSGGNKYSTRAANAALCVSDISTADFLKYHDYLYGKDKQGKPIQPAEGTNGRTDNDLIDYAQAIGITGSDLTTLESCITSQQHVALVEAITQDWSKKGLNGTPVVIVNGKTLKNNTKAALDEAVAAAEKAAPKASGSASSSASSSASPSGKASASPSATAP